MDAASFLKMDVFFFVTTVAVTGGSLLLILIGWYVLRIVRDVHAITAKVRREADGIVQDISTVRSEITEGVQEVKDHVDTGVATVQAASKAIAGAGVVRALATVFESLESEQRKPVRRRSVKRTRA